MNIESGISEIKGIGTVKKKRFAKLGIYTVEDLLYYYPRGYRDKSRLTEIKHVLEGEYTTIRGIVTTCPSETRINGGKLLTKVQISDDTGVLEAVWFNNRFIKNMLKQNETYYFYGKVSKFGKKKSIDVPEFEKVGMQESKLLRIVPEYGLTEGLTQRDIRDAVSLVLAELNGSFQDVYDDVFRERFSIPEINYAFQNLHFPKDFYALELARKRFKFEELLIVQYGLSRLKNKEGENHGPIFQKFSFEKTLLQTLPYSLTEGQQNALEDIKRDMISGEAMNRLLQGDVGSGKTIVAAVALLRCVENGYQGAFLVPTEILAEQHLFGFLGYFEPLGISVALLKGGMKAGQKAELCRRLKDHEIDILIGTHALLEDHVLFSKLGLVVTDEQHRFGVKQRAMMASKGQSPHMLVMTATPIPRSLSLILYGDLDVSVMRDKPIGRKKIETLVINTEKKKRMFGFLKKQIDMGRQVYMICPLIEQNELLELQSATAYYEELKESDFLEYRLALLHGKMKSMEKEEIMRQFRDGEVDVLISTTVVEVGVNVVNATIMVIENAERYGLSQLHQLRGRVGRGSEQSYCILVSDSQNPVSKERLKIIKSTEDGFEIAEKDLQLRGGGEMLGTKQHGTIQFKIADILNDTELLYSSRQAADYLLHSALYDRTKEYIMMKLNRILNHIVLN